jgi:hypothetical protein
MRYEILLPQRITELLAGSFVYAIGINTASPIVEFANNTLNRRLTLRINSELAVAPAPALPKELGQSTTNASNDRGSSEQHG